MQVSVEVTQGVGREMTVGVPREKVDAEIQTRLKTLSRTAKLNGFRPGKVPLRVLEKRFGKQVRGEVVSELVQSTFSEAITQSEVKIASEPLFQNISDSPQEDLEYKVAFAVLPEIDSVNVEGIAVEQWNADIEDSDVDEVVEKLREQHKTWVTVERPSQLGDQVVVDYKATVEGEEKSEAEDAEFILGSGGYLDGFEEGLTGVSKGDELTLDLNVPDSADDAEVAGKPIQFTTTIKAVNEPTLAEIDEAFIKDFGVEDGTMDSFRDAVRANMQRELEQALKKRNRQELFNKLMEQNPIELPDTVLGAAAQREKQNMAAEWQSQGMDSGILEQLDPNLFKDRAQREMHLGLLMSCISSSNEFEADESEIRAKVMEMASTYEEPEAVVNWVLSEENQVERFSLQVVEDKVNDWLLERADIETSTVAFEEAIEWAKTGGATPESDEEAETAESESDAVTEEAPQAEEAVENSSEASDDANKENNT